MAQYDVINHATGETKVIECSVHDITAWYEANPEWKRDWSQGCAAAQEMGEWKDKLMVKIEPLVARTFPFVGYFLNRCYLPGI